MDEWIEECRSIYIIICNKNKDYGIIFTYVYTLIGIIELKI